MNDPFRVFEQLRDAYVRYLDSPFRLRYPALMDERRSLLNQDRQLFRKPLFEPVVPYQSSGMTLGQACAALGVSSDVADFIETGGLFPAGRELFQHQYDAWQASRGGDAVIVTTGTGSGKTECYLLPVFAYLVEESTRWSAPAQRAGNYLWWNRPRQARIPQRDHDTGRPAALRALFLYPLNALIEDQLGRIRVACDGADGRTWLDQHRSRNRFWFGRYTGATPVSGPRENSNKRQELKRRLNAMEIEWNRARVSAAQSGSDEILSYFQDPSGSEMWSRWDIHDAPPDILITNYSMLNIMLMRSLEDDIFEATRRWLASDRKKNVFHLVVDELHTYRGTPGTEVGYLLRAFLHRLDLTPDSFQLKIIATSASIDANDTGSTQYLEEFFGRDPNSFEIIDGDPATFPTGASMPTAQQLVDFGTTITADLPAAVAQLAADVNVVVPPGPAEHSLGHVLAESGLTERVRETGADEPFTSDRLGTELFGGVAEAEAAAAALVRGLVIARENRGGSEVAPLPLRTHYFFHNAGRLWVCVNPACSGRTGITPPNSPAPTVGKLYVEPRPRCDDCNARVLELLYCQPCGDVFLGGVERRP